LVDHAVLSRADDTSKTSMAAAAFVYHRRARPDIAGMGHPFRVAARPRRQILTRFHQFFCADAEKGLDGSGSRGYLNYSNL
jgi:hypothetical protein